MPFVFIQVELLRVAALTMLLAQGVPVYDMVAESAARDGRLTVLMVDGRRAGAPLPVIVSLVNTGTKPLTYQFTTENRDFDIRVYDVRGREVEFTSRGQSKNGPAITHQFEYVAL